MSRTVLIIPADADALDYLDQAAEAGASEILTGVPPALLDLVEHVEHVQTDDDGEPVATVLSVAEPTVVVIDEPASDPAPGAAAPSPDPADVPTAQEQADAIVSLIFQAQSGVAPTPGFWAAVLAGMVDRGTASAETIDGALDHWRVISADEHAELRDHLEAAGGSAAPVEDLLDAAPRDA